MNIFFKDNITKKEIEKNWGWYLFWGIALIIIGSLMIVFSLFTTLVSVIVLGLAFLLNGIFEGIQAVKMRKWNTFFLHLIIGILFSITGILMIIYPVINALALTLLLGLAFGIGGIFRILFALQKSTPNYGWILFNGILTTILGLLILFQWPSTATWVIGTFLGIDMIFNGWTWMLLSINNKNGELKNGE